MTKPTLKLLTPKQSAFVDQYILTGNACEAYRIAYPCSRSWSERALITQASRSLHVPYITVAIAEKKAAIAKKVDLSQEWVLTRLMKNAERALQEIPVLNKDGKPTGEYTYEGSVANRALELLGKHVEMWPDKTKEGDGSPRVISVTLNIGDKVLVVQQEKPKKLTASNAEE